MSEKPTEEKRAEREAREREKEKERRAKREARLKKHAVDCPHCGKSVLDHMTKCPYCGGELTPKGYTPMDDAQRSKIRKITTIVGAVVAIAIIVVIFLFRKN